MTNVESGVRYDCRKRCGGFMLKVDWRDGVATLRCLRCGFECEVSSDEDL